MTGPSPNDLTIMEHDGRRPSVQTPAYRTRHVGEAVPGLARNLNHDFLLEQVTKEDGHDQLLPLLRLRESHAKLQDQTLSLKQDIKSLRESVQGIEGSLKTLAMHMESGLLRKRKHEETQEQPQKRRREKSYSDQPDEQEPSEESDEEESEGLRS